MAGETPIVDVQSAKRVRTMDNEMVQALPTAKGYASLMLLIPSMVQTGGGVPNVQLQPGMVVFGGQGGRGNEGRVQVDGLNTGASINGGGVSGYRQDIENSAEIAMTTAGGLGETEVGGPTMNIVPKTGGNTFTGHFFATGLKGGMQSDNFTQRLIDAGLPSPQPDQLPVRHERVGRRSDHQGSAVVLRADLLPRQRQRHLDVPQRERRRPHQVDLRAPTPNQPGQERQQRSPAAGTCA